MSEKKFEPCTLEEATHVEMGGKVYELGEDEFTDKHQVLKYNNYTIEVYRGAESGILIHVNAFELLGIKPLREIKPEPVEFEATFAKYDGKWHPLYSLDDGFSYQNCKTAKFKCVQIVEEEK